jgi:hypothetical protein
MTMFEVEITIIVSIPVEADTENTAADIAVGDPLTEHLANGNLEIADVNIRKDGS